MEKEVILTNNYDKIEVNTANLKLDKMRYQNNTISYMLGMLGIGLSIFAAFILLNSATPRAMALPKILMNIVILLFGFMSCEKVKAYSKSYSFVMFGIAAINVARIFWIPIQLMYYYNIWYPLSLEKAAIEAAVSGAAGNATADQTARLNEITPIIVNAAKYIGPVIRDGNNYLPQSGVFRGVFAIILLVGSAVCFAFAGLICYGKNKVLTNYLASLDKE